MNFRFSYSLILILLLITLTACPNLMVRQVDKMRNPDLSGTNQPKGRNFTYIRSSLPVDSLIAKFRSDSLLKNMPVSGFSSTYSAEDYKSPGNEAEFDKTLTNSSPQLRFDIRSVNSDNYPYMIQMKAVVYDTSGSYITGLAPPYFTGKGHWRDYWTSLIDSSSCAESSISDFDVKEIRQNIADPYAMLFALDHSGSMGREKVYKLHKAVRYVLRAVKPGDMVSILKFTEKQYLEVPLTGDRKEFLGKMDIKKMYSGATALYDAIVRGIYELDKTPGTHEKVLIAFTDGLDGNSKVKLDSVIKLAKERKVKLYTIFYESGFLGFSNPEPMIKLAEFSGGKYYHIYSSKEFVYVFTDIYISLNNYYMISYKPPACEDLHTAKLTLNFPGNVVPPMTAEGIYDKSFLKMYDPVGTVSFLNIEFQSGSSEILPESLPLIKKIAKSLRENPKMRIRINGHTDNIGDEDSNQKLSEKRAEAVFKLLTASGIKRTRIRHVGFGESRPLTENNSEAGRRKNRRTEFVIIGN